MSRGTVIVIVVMLVVGFAAGAATGYYFSHPSSPTSSSVTVIAAGSTTDALETVFGPEFQNVTGIKTGFTFGGSVADAQEIKTGSSSDVFVSAAAGVIPQYLFPNYAKWMVIFASNEMAITWNNSKYNISPGSAWFENISAPGITVAVSNSSLDPSGFQAIEMIKLAGILYTQWNSKNSNVSNYVKEAFNNNFSDYIHYNRLWNSWFENGSFVSEDYGSNNPMALYDQLFVHNLKTGDLLLTSEEYSLNGYLSSGSADYALTYKSQAINQNLYYFKDANGGNGLNSWINLGNISRDQVNFYQEVNTSGPSVDNIKVGNNGSFPGGPILYGVTIIAASKNLQNAQLLIYSLISNIGVSAFNSSGFDIISVPFVYSPYSEPPSFLNGLTQPVPTYFPASSYEIV